MLSTQGSWAWWFNLNISREHDIFMSYFRSLATEPHPEWDIPHCFIAKLWNEFIDKGNILDVNHAKSLLRQDLNGDQDIIHVFDLIHGRIHNSNSANTNSQAAVSTTSAWKKGIVNFLKDPNVRRKYLFYPKQTLAATCSRYRMKGLTESKSERTLINGIVKYENDKQLPNHLPPVETKEEVQERSISHALKNSFQKRFTGTKQDTGMNCCSQKDS